MTIETKPGPQIIRDGRLDQGPQSFTACSRAHR
jgi:hypothetical protein